MHWECVFPRVVERPSVRPRVVRRGSSKFWKPTDSWQAAQVRARLPLGRMEAACLASPRISLFFSPLRAHVCVCVCVVQPGGAGYPWAVKVGFGQTYEWSVVVSLAMGQEEAK